MQSTMTGANSGDGYDDDALPFVPEKRMRSSSQPETASSSPMPLF